MPGILTYMLSDVNSPESVASFHFCRLEECFQRVVHLAPGRQAFRLGEKKNRGRSTELLRPRQGRLAVTRLAFGHQRPGALAQRRRVRRATLANRIALPG